MNIKELWESIEKEEVINWHHEGYKIVKSYANRYNKDHFTYKNEHVLVIRHVEGFQCILHENEMKDLYKGKNKHG